MIVVLEVDLLELSSDLLNWSQLKPGPLRNNEREKPAQCFFFFFVRGAKEQETPVAQSSCRDCRPLSMAVTVAAVHDV